MLILLPVKANINVLVIVPITSFPIFIPELKSCELVKLLFTSYISNTDDVMDIVVSIIAPSEEIIIPASKVPAFKPGKALKEAVK